MHPVLSCREAVELEKGLLRGESDLEWKAMNRAGSALAEALLKDWREIGGPPESPRILILAGKGHNAGDAFLAVREILTVRPGARVDVLFCLGEDSLNPLARRAWTLLAGEAANTGRVHLVSLDGEGDVPRQLNERCGKRYHLFLDGLFGMNFRPPFHSPMDTVVAWCNEDLKADLRAAVDLPSGLSDEPTDLVIRADFSYMTGSPKRPLFEPAQAEWCGRLRYLDLGFFEGGFEGSIERKVILPQVLEPVKGLRGTMTHKRDYGHLLIAGGSRRMPGAILMSIMAAARSGVGLLTAAVPESLVSRFSTMVPEAMWIGCPETEEGGLALDGLHQLEKILAKTTAVLIGPGVGVEAETQAMLEELVNRIETPLVIDAEALQERLIERLRSRNDLRGKVAITPHAGEFARITGRKFAETGEEGLLRFCRDTGLLVLLKGPPFTRLCDGETISYGLPGGPVLARGGSGDILSGIAGSQVARSPSGIGDAMRRAIVWHGLAAEALAREFGQEAVRTTQLLDFLPRVLREKEAE